MSVWDLFRLDGKVALITGGGRGLGQQIAEAYAEAGATVVLASRKVDACEQVQQAIEAAGGRAHALALDVTDATAVGETVRAVVEQYGHLDILVNNSGTSWGAPALDMPLEAWRKVIDTNLTGSFLMAQAAARPMRAQGGGKIVNIASVAGLQGSLPEVLDAVGYSASKGGIIAMTRDLAVKWARYHICVNAIAPGFFPTKLTKDVLKMAGDRITNGVPLGRLGGERDLQGAALYFASAASDYTTGQVLAVDGGSSVS
ncbi:MAG: SDR family oxidoreductase [Alicyclobacillus sp.]|nr:SDR family oxidoreductase [Alicyclobacillus sp.]